MAPDVDANHLPIIFSHYGDADYLSKSLLCAALTNPLKRKILIGDESNRYTALANGWEHVGGDTLASDLRREFNAHFVHVRGRDHGIVKNGGDWLRYVFERWYMVEKLCADAGIDRFWHFDSDVMILEDLRLFEAPLIDICDFTSQCNDGCLNGMVSRNVLTSFCGFIIALFKDKEFLAGQQAEFDSLNPGYAFTEMRAYQQFAASPSCVGRGRHLESVFQGWWFDDCICQDDDFRMEMCASARRPIKRIAFREGAFWGERAGILLRFAALNLSWVPTRLFDWVVSGILRRQLPLPAEFPVITDWPDA